MPPSASAPTGTVTFLFTDIEGSTRLLLSLGTERYRSALGEHRQLVRAAVDAHHGLEMGTEGDAFFVAFHRAADAVQAAAEAQQALAAHAWPDGQTLRVRMGIHTSEAQPSAQGYVGIGVHRAARIAAAAHGGQVLVSHTTADLLEEEEGTRLVDLGEYRLKDLTQAQRIFQLSISGLPDRFPPIRGLGTALTNLPVQLTTFVGRDREMADLRGLAGSHRLITLIGTGGTGKTRLMLQLGAELGDAHPDGVWLIELAPLSNPALVIQEVARAVGASEEPGRPLDETLMDFLRSKKLVLLLDNCEHLIEESAGLADRLLAGCPDVMIIASSREALAVNGELVFQVPSLALPPVPGSDPDRGAADAWFASVQDSETVQLFVDRATAALPSFVLTRDNGPAVAEICRRLDGIPLAIELAAARVTVLSVEEIALRLGDRFRLLTGGRRTAVPRQQTLQALIDWSWDLLTEPDQRLIRRLSVFVGGWTLEAATAVTREPDDGDDVSGAGLDGLDGLSRLVDRSMVVVEHGRTSRYRMLETIRQYARERLIGAGEGPVLRDRHLTYFLDLALEAQAGLIGPDMIPWLERLDAEADNLRAALEWSFEADPERALRLTLALMAYWRSRSEGTEAVDRARPAAELALSLLVKDTAPEPRTMALVIRTLSAAAMASALWADAAAGRSWADQAVALARETNEIDLLADALSAKSTVAAFMGNEEGAGDLLAEAIRLLEEIGDWWGLAMSEGGAAMWEATTGNLDDAARHVVRATEAAERSGNPFVMAFAALGRADMLDALGRLDEARDWFGQAIAGFEQLGDRRLVRVARSDLAHAARHAGEIDEAEALYRTTLREWQHAGNRGAVANQLECFGFIAIARDAPLHAARLLGAAEHTRDGAAAPMLGNERVEYDAAVAILRDKLEPAALDAAWSEGTRLTLDEAVSLALTGVIQD